MNFHTVVLPMVYQPSCQRLKTWATVRQPAPSMCAHRYNNLLRIVSGAMLRGCDVQLTGARRDLQCSGRTRRWRHNQNKRHPQGQAHDHDIVMTLKA